METIQRSRAKRKQESTLMCFIQTEWKGSGQALCHRNTHLV